MEGRVGSGGPSEELGGVGRKAEDGRPFQKPGGVRSPFQRAGSGLEALLAGREGWEAHPDGQMVWKPSQQGQEELGVPHGGREGS